MSDYWTHTIGRHGVFAEIRIRQFQNGNVQIYQSNTYGGRHGKTIYLSPEQFKLLQKLLIEEMP